MHAPNFYPRPDQVEADQALWDYFVNGGTGNPLIAMPTGTGKSVGPPMFMRRAFQSFPNSRMVMLTHVKELVAQNEKALDLVWPGAPKGVYAAGLNRKEAYAPIVFGSIQSAKANIQAFGHRDLMFIDEAHLLSPRDNSMYQTVIDQLKVINPHLKVIGLTATPYRMGQGRLTDASWVKDPKAVEGAANNGKILKPALFTDVVFDITGMKAFNRLIDEYYLSPLVPRPTDVTIDVTDCGVGANGDYIQSQLQQAIASQDITKRALIEAREVASDRKSWVVFGAGIENCERITELLRSLGISAVCVHSKMQDKEARDRYIQMFKAGQVRAIVSNNILTTGFDHPAVDCIIDLRPTVSVVLHIQKYGRGTRPYFHHSFNHEKLQYIEHRKTAIELAGKRNCIVLDFAGNTRRLGPINDVVPPKSKGPGTGEVPIKICEICGAYNHTVARICAGCNGEFVFKSKIKQEASTAEIIRRVETKHEIFNVTNMQTYWHQKSGKTPKIKVQYFSGMQMFNTWIGFEPNEKGLVKHKAHEWWRQHGNDPIPESTQEALDRIGECRTTSKIKVDTSQKYPEILEFLF